jgi:hypothetical protein
MAEEFAQTGEERNSTGMLSCRHGALQLFSSSGLSVPFSIALHERDDPAPQKILVRLGVLQAPERGHAGRLAPAQFQIHSAAGADQQFAATVLIEKHDRAARAGLTLFRATMDCSNIASRNISKAVLPEPTGPKMMVIATSATCGT